MFEWTVNWTLRRPLRTTEPLVAVDLAPARRLVTKRTFRAGDHRPATDERLDKLSGELSQLRPMPGSAATGQKRLQDKPTFLRLHPC